MSDVQIDGEVPDWLLWRVPPGVDVVMRLLAAPPIRFEPTPRSALPTQHGVYAFSIVDGRPGDFLQAGATLTAKDGLQQRIYHDHLHVPNESNLNGLLVKADWCKDREDAKRWIKSHCEVRFLVIDDLVERETAEHFLHALLRPVFGDRWKDPPPPRPDLP